MTDREHNKRLCELLHKKRSLAAFIEREAVQYPAAETRAKHRQAARELHGWFELLAEIKELTKPNRQEQIAKGKLWTVHDNNDDGLKPDVTHFEGSRSACLRFIRERFRMRAYKTGKIRLGQIIWEPKPSGIPIEFAEPTVFAVGVGMKQGAIVGLELSANRGAISI